jgi:hypothetical protein
LHRWPHHTPTIVVGKKKMITRETKGGTTAC